MERTRAYGGARVRAMSFSPGPLIRVKDHSKHNGLMKTEQRETSDYQLTLPQSLLEDARQTEAGRFLIQLLASVDYAGCGIDKRGKRMKRNPVVLIGWKHRQSTTVGDKQHAQFVDGFTIYVSVPVRVDTAPPALYTP